MTNPLGVLCLSPLAPCLFFWFFYKIYKMGGGLGVQVVGNTMAKIVDVISLIGNQNSRFPNICCSKS